MEKNPQRQRPRDSVLTVRQCCCIFVSLGLVGVNGLHLEVKMLEGGRLLDINRCQHQLLSHLNVPEID